MGHITFGYTCPGPPRAKRRGRVLVRPLLGRGLLLSTQDPHPGLHPLQNWGQLLRPRPSCPPCPPSEVGPTPLPGLPELEGGATKQYSWLCVSPYSGSPPSHLTGPGTPPSSGVWVPQIKVLSFRVPRGERVSHIRPRLYGASEGSQQGRDCLGPH